MLTDILKSLRASCRFFLRDLKYRRDKRKRAMLHDPLKG